jgi:glycosyltransferase involved in cell wall biosynthesis
LAVSRARVVFIDPFFDGSHRAFAEGLVLHSRHEIELLTLPTGEWRRRMRLGAQELARAMRGLPGTFDAIVATDMLDLPAFLALTRPRFERTPILVYFHENQLTYPRLRGTKLNSWFGAMNYLSALAADGVAFNSEYHRVDFLGALRTLVAGPHNWLDVEGIETIESKSSVLPVGVDLGWAASLDTERQPTASTPLILWNQRWEFDKAPDVFARALTRLAGEGVPFRAAIAGEPGPNPHPALFELRDHLAERVVHFGRADDGPAYHALLSAADVVVSAARHEFFGVAMVEALAAGCIPVAPSAYNYPALIPSELHSRLLWTDEEDLCSKLQGALHLCRRPDEAREIRTRLRALAMHFDWSAVAKQWDAALDDLIAK